jgi:hypothetical protein
MRDYDDGDCDFAEPGGRSALRAASKLNPRNLPCPSCGRKNVLTPADRARTLAAVPTANTDRSPWVLTGP